MTFYIHLSDPLIHVLLRVLCDLGYIALVSFGFFLAVLIVLLISHTSYNDGYDDGKQQIDNRKDLLKLFRRFRPLGALLERIGL